MNNCHIIVFDFETTGLTLPTDLATPYSEPVELAAQAYDARTLEPFPKESGGRFVSLMKPLQPERLDEPKAVEALRFNGIKKDDILAAPDQKAVWTNFIKWVNGFNLKAGPWTAPIPAGMNILNFDMKIVNHLNLLHGPKKDKTTLFHQVKVFDLMQIFGMWFEDEKEPSSWSMDSMRDFFGIPKEGSHRAEVDIEHEGWMLIKFLKLARFLQKEKTKDGKKRINFAQSFRRPAAT